ARRRLACGYLPATVETYFATAWIWAAVSLPLNAGMTPPPFVTCFATVSWSGLRSSRFGPVVPDAPAAFSVWQLLQPADAKVCLPCAPPDPPPPPPPPPPPVVVGGGAAPPVAFTPQDGTAAHLAT